MQVWKLAPAFTRLLSNNHPVATLGAMAVRRRRKFLAGFDEGGTNGNPVAP